MNSTQLFALKEEMLKKLSDSMSSMEFNSPEQKSLFYNTSMEAIMDFYTESMTVILESEKKKSRTAA